MKKFILLLLFVPIISCSGDGYSKANLELTTGCFTYGSDDTRIIILTKNTIQLDKVYKSGFKFKGDTDWIHNLKRSSTDYAYYLSSTNDADEKVIEAKIEYNPELKRYRVTRFDKRMAIEYWTKVDCQ